MRKVYFTCTIYNKINNDCDTCQSHFRCHSKVLISKIRNTIFSYSGTRFIFFLILHHSNWILNSSTVQLYSETFILTLTLRHSISLIFHVSPSNLYCVCIAYWAGAYCEHGTKVDLSEVIWCQITFTPISLKILVP